MSKLTPPEDRAQRLFGDFYLKDHPVNASVVKEIRAALTELVEVAWERAPVNSDTDTFIDIELLTELVNEVLPEEERIK